MRPFEFDRVKRRTGRVALPVFRQITHGPIGLPGAPITPTLIPTIRLIVVLPTPYSTASVDRRVP